MHILAEVIGAPQQDSNGRCGVVARLIRHVDACKTLERPDQWVVVGCEDGTALLGDVIMIEFASGYTSGPVRYTKIGEPVGKVYLGALMLNSGVTFKTPAEWLAELHPGMRLRYADRNMSETPWFKEPTTREDFQRRLPGGRLTNRPLPQAR